MSDEDPNNIHSTFSIFYIDSIFLCVYCKFSCTLSVKCTNVSIVIYSNHRLHT